MTASLLLSVALMTQTAGTTQTTNTPSTGQAAPQAKAQTKPDFKATIQSTLARKKAAQAKKSKARVAKRLQEQAEAKARRDQAERLAPVLAAQQRDGMRFQMEAQAIQRMSDAMMLNAETNQMRLRLQSQQAGVPQIFVPGEGFTPYAGGIAAPYPPVIVVP